MKIIIEQKQVYGKTLYYPVCETAQIFSSLTKTRTLDRFQLQKIKDLGFDIHGKDPYLTDQLFKNERYPWLSI